MVVGGVVSTMLLHARQSTQDVDFFTSQLSTEDATLLGEASRDVTRRIQHPKLGAGWFNNRTTLFISETVRAQLLAEGRDQNITVFEAPGLKLLAAPWEYQFCAKVHRMSGGGGKGHDGDDAASYLHQFLMRRNMVSVSARQIRGWFEKYGLPGVVHKSGFTGALHAVNDVYAQKYRNVRPIII
jgi:hypothetical protein